MQPDEPADAALKRLEQRLGAAEAEQARRIHPDAHQAMAQGYRFLGEVVGGVLGGAGLGWLVDHFAGTAPLGLVGGLLLGSGGSIFFAVSAAAKANRKALEQLGPRPGVSADEDED
jgi:ATP synthase protein I